MSSEGHDLAYWRGRAERLLKEGKRGGPEVIEANAAILDLDRSDNDARTRLGFAYRLEGDYDSAEAVYGQILESVPTKSDLHGIATRALVLVAKERAANTRPYSLDEHLAAVINADDAYQRASALRDEGKLGLALRWVERGLELAERQGRAKRRRGLAVRASIRRAEKQPLAALEDARASVALGLPYEDNPSGYVVLVACLVDLDEWTEALEIVSAHMEADTSNVYAMNAAGRALLAAATATGEVDLFERGEICFRRATALTRHKSPRQRLGELFERYLKLGMNEKAADLRVFLDSLGPDLRAS